MAQLIALHYLRLIMKITLTNADTGQPIEIETDNVCASGSSWHNGKDTNCIRVAGSAEDIWIVEDYREAKSKLAQTDNADSTGIKPE